MSQETFCENYSSWYDAFNHGKDYAGEAQLVLDKAYRWLTSNDPLKTLEIIDFGCGSGLHDVEFSKAGHNVVGVDASSAMLSRAKLSGMENVILGDVRDPRIFGQFDLAVSLFHVMSYMVSDRDVDALFANASNNLNANGLFIFDFWNSAVVLSSPQPTRFKQVDLPTKKIYRISNSTYDNPLSQVLVHFDVFCEDLLDESISHFQEAHRMRHFSLNEITRIAEYHGFSKCEDFDWNTDDVSQVDTFSRTVVFKKG